MKNILQAIIITFSLITSYSINAENNLILHYEFNDESGKIQDSSPVGNHGVLKGNGATIKNGVLTLPGGAAGSDAAYVELPQGIFDTQNTLSISVWLKNQTGSGNYAAMYIGTTESTPSQYWLLNPANPAGLLKSVLTNDINTASPWNTEYGFSPTVSSQGLPGPVTDTNWNLYTTIIQPGTITLYYNATKIGSVNTSRSISQFGNNLVGYVGRSAYNDKFYQGEVMDLKIYNRVLSEAEITHRYKSDIFEPDYDNLNIPSRVTGNINLPTRGAKGSDIIWSSSDIALLNEKGEATLNNEERQVLLTATVQLGNQRKIKKFPITIAAKGSEEIFENLAENYDLGIQYITENIKLPTEINGIKVSWSSNNAAINNQGIVTRPPVGSGNQPATLTATFHLNGKEASKDFNIIVAEADYGYLLSYVLNGNTGRTDCLHLAYSLDGKIFEAMNKGKAVKYPLAGTKKMGSPVIFRKPDGKFGLIASDDNNSPYVMIYDSDDLINYTNERLVRLTSGDNIKVQNLTCRYDPTIKAYRIQWQGNDKKYYESITSDLKEASYPALLEDNYIKPEISASLPTGATEGHTIALTKAEYEKVTGKYMNIKNTGVKEIPDINIAAGASNIDLPQKVTLQYNDGSTKDMGVSWNQKDIEAVKLDIPGTYTVKGNIIQPVYKNPFIEQRADPYIVKGEDGYYYFTASYPMVGSNDPEGYDRIILRRSTTLQGLENSPEITIWDEKNSSTSFRYVWAPELHFINGTWYVLFTTSQSKSNVWGIRPVMIACTQGDKDPYNPDCWEKEGHYCEAFNGDAIAFSHFSLDMTYFELNGEHYVVWAEKPGTSNLMIASVDPAKPWIMTSKSVLLSQPEYAWEWKNNDWVNEGPAVIKNNGKVYIAFSASAVDETYCVGFLYADETSDLLNATSWTKTDYPVLESVDLENQNGPGHNSFTIDEYGNPVIVYHARTPGDPGDKGLYDPGRHARIKNMNFNADGVPVLNMTPEEELNPAYKEVQVNIIVK